MKKSVELKIKSSQYEEKLRPSGEAFVRDMELDDSFEIITSGTIYTKNDSTYITYEESREMGLEDGRTLLKLYPPREEEYELAEGGDNVTRKRTLPQSLRVRKYHNGDDDTDMMLTPGQRYITRYKIPQLASMDIEVYTIEVTAKLDEEGYGTILADYRIKFDQFFSRRNRLEIEINELS